MKAPRFSLDGLPKKYRDQATAQLNKGKTAHPFALLESDTVDEPMGAEETKRHDALCCIHIHSIRKRLADPDGVSAKACIDGLVHAGLLQDDSPKYVKEVSYSQEKGKEEETIITITYDE